MNLIKYIKEQILSLNYYYLIALLLSLFFTISIFYDLFQIHIYRHDDLYYMLPDNYFGYIDENGRWLNYIFFHFAKSVSGKLWAIFILISFAYFIFICAYKWTQHIFYSILLTLLFLQIPSFYPLIQWPSSSVPTFFVLLLAIYLVTRLPIFIFYSLFGILFFATMSNYYYLLPLLHLSLLTKNTAKDNIKIVFFKIIPAWGVGFIIGFMVSQLVVYLLFGHFMQLSPWRNPHYIHSLQDVTSNIQLAFESLLGYIKNIFSNKWVVATGILGLIISLWGRKKDLIFLPLLIFFTIIIIHFIMVIPVGIDIQPRTVVATWVGVLAIIFFIPLIKQWKVILLTPIIILFTYNLYVRNHNNLKWYSTITNTHYNMLQKISPMPPQMYEGVVLFSSDSEIKERNKFISKQYNLHKDYYMEKLGHFKRWATVAKEAGFKHVVNCNKAQSITADRDHKINAKLLCKELSNNYLTNSLLKTNTYGFFHMIGEYNNMLILSFDNNNNLVKTIEKK